MQIISLFCVSEEKKALLSCYTHFELDYRLKLEVEMDLTGKIKNLHFHMDPIHVSWRGKYSV